MGIFYGFWTSWFLKGTTYLRSFSVSFSDGIRLKRYPHVLWFVCFCTHFSRTLIISYMEYDLVYTRKLLIVTDMIQRVLDPSDGTMVLMSLDVCFRVLNCQSFFLISVYLSLSTLYPRYCNFFWAALVEFQFAFNQSMFSIQPHTATVFYFPQALVLVIFTYH